jgi:hypothetical protein
MAVSVSLDPSSDSGVCLEDDGYYWFLYPYFERVSAVTGQMVDPYGDAVFTTDDLTTLMRELEGASAEAGVWGEDRDVRVGWRGEQQVFEKVSKDRLRGLIGELIAIVTAARETSARVVCVGD